MRSTLDCVDWALLAAYLLAAALGTWTSCLLFHDGAILLSAAWLGDAWDLYFSQNASRAVSTLLSFGPIWVLRRTFDISSSAFILLGHVLYFSVPLGLWVTLRLVEPVRLFSRLYLSFTLALIYFVAELVIGAGLWMIWMSLVINPARSTRQIAIATLLLGAGMAFSHPTTGLMSLLFVLVGGALTVAGRPFPARALIAAAVLTVLLVAAYLAALKWLPATNPTIITAVARIRYDYIDPRWMLKTIALYPMLAALWLLLLVPGFNIIGPQWRFSRLSIAAIATAGLWFAAAGTALLTWLYARHTGSYILVVATALALVMPTAWLKDARRPLMLYAAFASVAFVSYNYDLFLFGRFVDSKLSPGVVDVDKRQTEFWPAPFEGPAGPRILFKWAVGRDYVHDFVVPTYDWWYRVTLAFYSFFRSDRRSVLFHEVGRPGDWVPFECGAIKRTRERQHDPADQMLLAFLADHYCVR